MPTHITRHSTVVEGCSSEMSSTSCPRFRREAPPILKPSCELSRMRQGILCACRPYSTIRLAHFFRAVRFDRRRSGMGPLGTSFLRGCVFSRVRTAQRLLAAEGISSQALPRLQHGLAASAPGVQPLVIYRTAIYAEKWWQRGVVCLLSQTQRLDSAFLAYAQIAYSTPGLCSQRIIVLNDLIRRGFAS